MGTKIEKEVSYQQVYSLIKDSGMSDAEFAEKMGYTRTWLPNGKRNNRKWSQSEINLACHILNCEEKDLTEVKQVQCTNDCSEQLEIISNKLTALNNTIISVKKQMDDWEHRKNPIGIDALSFAEQFIESLFEDETRSFIDNDFLFRLADKEGIDKTILQLALDDLGYKKRQQQIPHSTRPITVWARKDG